MTSRHKALHVGVLLKGALGLALFGATVASVQAADIPPVPTKLPPGELGKMVELGRDIVNHTTTNPLSKPYTGNALNCTSCHLNGGTDLKGLSFLGTAAAYPTYTPREKKVISLEDRSLNCFMRSMNGIRPENGSKVSMAIATYITWLSEGYPIKMSLHGPHGPNAIPQLKLDPAKGSVERGKSLYDAKCASCHGVNGEGVGQFPPVWGDKSFNHGAGLSHPVKLATFIKNAMPLGNANLTVQEALDIAVYVDSKPRAKFVLKDHLGKNKE